MPRQPREATGGLVYHVLNRGLGRMTVFELDGDYVAFLRTVDEVQRRVPTRVLAYCLMPNPWHLVLGPEADGRLSEFLRLRTVMQSQRWYAFHKTSGRGALYQGKLKIARSRALGDDGWVKQTPARLGLGHALRPNGRPRSAREVS